MRKIMLKLLQRLLGKHIVVFTVSDGHLAEMKELVALYGHVDTKDMFNHAITAWEWILRETVAGKTIVSIDHQNDSYKELEMPILVKINQMFEGK